MLNKRRSGIIGGGLNGTLIKGLNFIERPHALHVINAPSPRAAASLAIDWQIVENVCRIAGLN